MKSNINKRILRLASTEILIQLGFEKSTEQSLNIINEVFTYYMEALIKRMIPFEKANYDSIIKMLIDEFYGEEQFQISELSQFLELQNQIKKQLKEKSEFPEDTSLLHSLKVLPRGVNFKSTFKNTKNMAIEEKNSNEVFAEVVVDDFLNNFIEESSKENGKKIIQETISENSKNLEKIVLETKFGDRNCGHAKELNIKPQEDIIKEQEFFIEDFGEIEKYKTFKC